MFLPDPETRSTGIKKISIELKERAVALVAIPEVPAATRRGTIKHATSGMP